MKKRPIPKHLQMRNLAYLAFIGLMLLFACANGQTWAWALFVATAYEFWPQGHYGMRGVR